MNKRAPAALLAAVALAGCASFGSVRDDPMTPAGSGVQHSWMLAEAASDELVYVSEQGIYNNPGVYVYSYPQGKQVGFLQEDTEEVYEGLCSDTSGNVWVVGWITNGQAFYTEYPHGGTQPIKDTISDGNPSGCSVDPTTGNLAVANYVDYTIGRRGDIAIWPNGSQKPTDYYDDGIKYYYYCAYDDKGNLYADGNAGYVNVLRKNSSTLEHAYFNKSVAPGSLQWNSGSLVVAQVGGAKGPVRVDRVTLQGSSARITGTADLRTTPVWGNYLNVEFWIQGKIIAGVGPGSGGPVRALYFWRYPAGGKAVKTIPAPDNGNFYGVAISP